MTQAGLHATINTIASVVRNIHLKRALASVDKNPSLNFWRLINSDVFNVAVLDWCKLFGSDDEEHQPVHWKNVVSDVTVFRSDLLNYLCIDECLWKTNWNRMKRYRDTQVAHLDFKQPRVDYYPDLELALQSTYFYYDHVLPLWRALGNNCFPADIRDYCTRFADQSKTIALTALSSTGHFEELVY